MVFCSCHTAQIHSARRLKKLTKSLALTNTRHATRSTIVIMFTKSINSIDTINASIITVLSFQYKAKNNRYNTVTNDKQINNETSAMHGFRASGKIHQCCDCASYPSCGTALGPCNQAVSMSRESDPNLCNQQAASRQENGLNLCNQAVAK